MVMAWAFELRAVRLAGFGFASPAPAYYLALAFSGAGLPLSLFTPAIAWVVRGVVRPSRAWASELALDAIPMLLALLVYFGFQGPWSEWLSPIWRELVCLQVYLTFVALVALFLSPAAVTPDEAGAWRHARLGFWHLQLGCGLVALLSCAAAERHTLYAWLLFPSSLVLFQVASFQRSRTQEFLRRQLDRRLENTRHELGHQVQQTRQEEVARQQWQDRAARLSELLAAAQGLTSSLELASLRSTLELWLQRLLPHQRRIYWTASSGAAAGLEADFVRGVASSRRVENTASSNFAPLGASLMALGPDPEGGYWILASDRVSAFTLEDQQLGELLLMHYALAARKAQYHQQVLESYRQLEASQAQQLQSAKLAAVGQLAAGMAHELNTPLATVLMAIEMAQLEARPQSKANLQLAVEQVRRAQELIEKVLYYSREASISRQAVQIEAIFEDTWLLVRSDFQHCGIQLQRQFESAPAVQVNVNELQQILLNLLINARDAAIESGRLEIRVGTHWDQARGEVEFWLCDQGPGMSPEVLERAFDPFYTTKGPGKGTGLGLSISREIATLHGGSLNLETQPGQGTKGRLRLPALL